MVNKDEHIKILRRKAKEFFYNYTKTAYNADVQSLCDVLDGINNNGEPLPVNV